MTDESGVRETLDLLSRALMRRFPDWSSELSSPERDPYTERMWLHISVPGRQTHTLSFMIGGNEIEVHYADGEPPGAAERLFVFQDAQRAEAIESVADFVSKVVQEHVAMARERLPRLIRFIRRDDCDSLLRFMPPEEATQKRKRMRAIYSWRRTYDYTGER